jgi:hypothetical protein
MQFINLDLAAMGVFNIAAIEPCNDPAARDLIEPHSLVVDYHLSVTAEASIPSMIVVVFNYWLYVARSLIYLVAVQSGLFLHRLA